MKDAVLDGRSIVEKKMVTFPDNLLDIEDQVQPNGVDLRICKARLITGHARLPRDGRMQTDDLQMVEVPAKNGVFELSHKVGVYLVDFLENISVPEGYCAIIVPRSSMVRVGAQVLTGLWDTGYRGQLGATIRLRNDLSIEWGAKLAQVMFLKSVFNGHRYDGAYQGTSHSTIR